MADELKAYSTCFDWKDLAELELCLHNLKVTTPPKAAVHSQHCTILRNTAIRPGATQVAIENAVELAKGHRDLAILLLEPADSEAHELHIQYLPTTIQRIDEELRACSRLRGWQNTCILDIRPFRSAAIRRDERGRERQKRQLDELAYNSTKMC